MGVIEKFLALGSIAIGSAALNYDKAKIPLAIPFLLDHLNQKTQNSEQNFVPFVYTKGLKFLRKFMSFGINRRASHIDGYFELFNNACCLDCFSLLDVIIVHIVLIRINRQSKSN